MSKLYKNLVDGYTPAMMDGIRNNLSQEQIKQIKAGGFIALDKIVPIPENIQGIYDSLKVNVDIENSRTIVVVEDSGRKFKNVDYRHLLNNNSGIYREIDFSKMDDENPRSRNKKNSLEQILN